MHTWNIHNNIGIVIQQYNTDGAVYHFKKNESGAKDVGHPCNCIRGREVGKSRGNLVGSTYCSLVNRICLLAVTVML